MMKTRIVRRYATPCYPTREYLIEHPELLRWVPERWKRNRLVLGVLSLVIPLIVARPAAAGDGKSAGATTSRVAPLFIHGDGRGSFGCIVVNPPVFLSEDEARQVVQDEARKEGITFSADGLTLKDVMLPVTDQFGFLREEHAKDGRMQKEPPPKAQKGDLIMDGYDRKHDIAHEVVTDKDFADWETKNRDMMCTVSSYDFKTTAEGLTNGLAHIKGKTILAVFYEPAASAPHVDYPKDGASRDDVKTYWAAREKAARELGTEELRQQVRDFLAWLKAQGVI